MPGPPDKIMFIRHAEKPENGSPGGVKEDGSSNKHSLLVRGWQRAGALTAFFAKPTRPGIATPTTIFACATSTDDAMPAEEAKSLRPVETVTPLGRKLGLAVKTPVPVGDEAAIIPLIYDCSGIVLVAWEHKRIPTIAAGFTHNLPNWGHRFDAVWVLDRSADGTYRLTVVNQDLMDGDAPP